MSLGIVSIWGYWKASSGVEAQSGVDSRDLSDTEGERDHEAAD